jgi:hypothetical protein
MIWRAVAADGECLTQVFGPSALPALATAWRPGWLPSESQKTEFLRLLVATADVKNAKRL